MSDLIRKHTISGSELEVSRVHLKSRVLLVYVVPRIVLHEVLSIIVHLNNLDPDAVQLWFPHQSAEGCLAPGEVGHLHGDFELVQFFQTFMNLLTGGEICVGDLCLEELYVVDHQKHEAADGVGWPQYIVDYEIGFHPAPPVNMPEHVAVDLREDKAFIDRRQCPWVDKPLNERVHIEAPSDAIRT